MHHRTIMAMAVFASVSITLAETHEIELYSTSFVPSAVDALPGDTIRWTFVTGYPHTVDSGTGCVPDGLFSASLSSPDQVFEWTVPEDAPTQIPFFCDPHCGNGMSGVINVLPSTEPGRLMFGIIDVSSGNIQMEIDEELGQGFLLVDALDGSFAFGFEVENGDVDVNFISSSNAYKTDAAGTTAITDGITTLSEGSRFVVHGEAGSDFSMAWAEEFGSEPALIGIDCGECSMNVNGDMSSFRYTGPFYATLDFRGGGEIPMSVIGDVESATLTLPGFGEEADVVLPAGEHTIVLGPDSGSDDIAWLLVGSGGGGDKPGGCPEDIDGSGTVDVGDLLAVIAAWGSICP
tara:strand:- start:508 stop:1551 length:1044 start_codon:yes stop_codon:yes gene_type:complete